MIRNLIIAAWLTAVLPASLIAFVPHTAVAAAIAEEREIFRLVNVERSRSRLGSLHWDDDLALLARNFSRRMARDRFFDHVDPDGKSVVERAEDAGLRNWRRIGENLFVTERIDGFSEFAVHGWLRSPSHRQNILDRKWTATGVGIAIDRRGNIFITQVFTED